MPAVRDGRSRLYFLLLFIQTSGLAVLIWQGAPAYRRIIAEPGSSAEARTLMLAALAVGLMQGAYWLRTTRIPSLPLPPNLFLNHVLLFVGRLSFLLGTALFTAVMYYRLPDLEKSLPRLAVLVASLFAMFCYSLELEWLARQLEPPIERRQ